MYNKTHRGEKGKASIRKRIAGFLAAFLFVAAAAVSLVPHRVFSADISGTVTASAVWSEGDVITDAVTIQGGTQEEPIVITVSGTVTLNAGIVISGGNVKFTGYGVLLRGNTFSSGNLVSVSSANATFEKITFDGNQVANTGYALYAEGTTNITINEGTVFCNNVRLSGRGSAICADSTLVHITMNGGEIRNNSQASYGAVYLNGDSDADPAHCTFTLNGGSITGNTCSNEATGYGGGGVYVRYATFIMNGGVISGNTVSPSATNGKGGGIYCSSYGRAVLNGGVVSANSASKGTGAYLSALDGADAAMSIGGDILFSDNVIHLDNNNSTVKYPTITSRIKNRLPLIAELYEENLPLAQGTDTYTLTEADMAKVDVKTPDGTQYYAKLSTESNQLLMTATNPNYAEPFSVSYYGNGGTGSVSDEALYSAGQTATVKENGFSRTGYDFLGYNTAANGTGTFYLTGELFDVTADTVLFAQWKATLFPVRFSLTGLTLTASTTTTAVPDTDYSATLVASAHYSIPASVQVKIGSQTLAQDDGYTYSASTGEITISGERITEAVAITATGTGELYSVAYSGMTDAEYGTNHPATHTYGTPTDISDPTKANWVFDGWKINDEGALQTGLTLGATDYTANISLEARWTEQTCTVTFDAAGGSTVPSVTGVSAGSLLTAPTAPTKALYDFAGWYKEAGLTNRWDFGTDTVSGNITLYAKWTPQITAVAFTGLLADGSATASTTVLTLMFDKDIAGLSADNITLTGAAGGGLTKAEGTGVYTLEISDITVADNGTVSVALNKDSFAFTPASAAVTVRKYTPPAPSAPTPSLAATPMVSYVTVSPKTASVAKGDSLTFSAAVTGANNPAQTVIWSVEGGYSPSTTITQGGKLTVAEGETATTLTVKATSWADTTKAATATVTVTEALPDPNADPITYHIIKGENGQWAQGGTGGLGFTADGTYSKFTGVAVDGVVVASEQYIAHSGSTVVTLKEAYLDTLAAGQHTLQVNFTDGYAETVFSVKAAPASVPAEPDAGGKKNAFPWWLLLLLVCALFFLWLIFKRKKRSDR